MTILAPPRLVGIQTVADLLGVSRYSIYARLANGEQTPGYLGKICNRHTWNMHELVASLFTSDASLEAVIDRMCDPTPSDPLDTLLCAATDCDGVADSLGLCSRHYRRLLTTWRHADRSSLVTIQLVAMCRWVVDRNAHLVLPDGFDPWASVCMTPGCGGSTNIHGPGEGWHGPLCLDCTAKLWQHPRVRPRPAWWKQGRAA